MWKILKLKKVWIPVLLVLIIVGLVFYSRNQQAKPKYTTETVKQQDLKQTVSVTGTVKAAEQVNLNFKAPGRLTSLMVKVGDKVKANTVIARLDSKDAAASVLTAQANLKSAEANLAKLKAGAQDEDVAVSQAGVSAAETTLNNAKQSLINIKASQDRAVANALAQLVGLTPQAIPARTNISTGSFTLSGTYQGTNFGTYTIRFDNRSNLAYSVYGLENDYQEGSYTTSTPIGVLGLRLQFSSTGVLATGDTWTIDIPNTSAASYTTYKAAYEAALVNKLQQIDTAEAVIKTAEQVLVQAKANFNFKTAPPRSYDILNVEAQVAAARATLVQAQNNLSDRYLTTPVNGTITRVNYEIGETTSLSSAVAVLLTDSQTEIKVQVPESDIAKLKIGQPVDITLDAFGSSEHFSSHIAFIDPAATVIQDVVYYEVTVTFDDAQDDRIKPGMTANLDIMSAEVKDVLVVPLRAVRYDSGQVYVEVLLNNELVRKNVVIGLKGDDGLVEIKEGLKDGEAIITFKSNGSK
ncbi:efflux RND transporter periplasmic adaptor subunit [Patescibacteria group bacterium]|nr:efflux RND transporter periplasmic adaptor subunit [Patescibacteria group bacterium]